MEQDSLTLLIRLDDGYRLKVNVPNLLSISQAVTKAEATLNKHLNRPLDPHPWLVKDVPVTTGELVRLLTRKCQKSKCSTIRLFLNEKINDQCNGLGKSVDAMYNKPAEALLRSQIVSKSNRSIPTAETGLSLKEETVLDKVRNLQLQIRDGTLQSSDYEIELKTLLMNQFSDGGDLTTYEYLRNEIETLRPQLFEANSKTSNWKDEEETKHKDLHTMHVLPVVKGLQQSIHTHHTYTHTDSHTDTTMKALPLTTWKDLSLLLTDCHSRAPLLFPHTVVVSMALHHDELLRGVEGMTFEGNLVTSESDALFPLVKDFARVVCSILKDHMASPLMGPTANLMKQVRRSMKLVFHKPAAVSCDAFRRYLLQLASVLDLLLCKRDETETPAKTQTETPTTHETETRQEYEKEKTGIVKRFSERLFFKLAINDSVHVSEAVRRLSERQTQGETETPDGRIVLEGDAACRLCHKGLLCLFVATRRGPTCVSCWLVDREASRADRVTRLVSSTPHETPVPATHLLTHQRNLWENKTGTRHAQLPDQRHAVISTAVHHLVRRRDKKDRVSVSESLPQGVTETHADSHTDSSSTSRTPIVPAPSEHRSRAAEKRSRVPSVGECVTRTSAAASVSSPEFKDMVKDPLSTDQSPKSATLSSGTNGDGMRGDGKRGDGKRGDGETFRTRDSETSSSVDIKKKAPSSGNMSSSGVSSLKTGRSMKQCAINANARVSSNGDGDMECKGDGDMECNEPHPLASEKSLEPNGVPAGDGETKTGSLTHGDVSASGKETRPTSTQPGDRTGQRRTSFGDMTRQRHEFTSAQARPRDTKVGSRELAMSAQVRRRDASTGDRTRRLSGGRRSFKEDLSRDTMSRLPASSKLTRSVTIPARSPTARANQTKAFSQSLTMNPRPTGSSSRGGRGGSASLRQSCPATSRSRTEDQSRDKDELTRTLTMGVEDPILTRLLAGTRPVRRRQ